LLLRHDILFISKKVDHDSQKPVLVKYFEP